MKEKARLTLDMSQEQHMFLKMASARLGISMREFLLISAFKEIEKLEDEWLAEKAQEALEEIELGKAKTFSWKKARKKLS